MKILVVLPMYGGSLPVGRYCASALERLGHQVDVFDAPVFKTAFDGLKGLKVSSSSLDHLENSFLQVVSSAVLAKVETMQPGLVLALAQAPLSRQALSRLRQQGVPTAMWFVEDFRVFQYWRSFAPYYDFFAVIQKQPFFEELKKSKVREFMYLPLAADPEFHRPLQPDSVEKRRFGSDISFLGAGYPNRRKAFGSLLGYDLKIWGTEWDGAAELKPFVQMQGRRIEPEEAVRIFCATKINLNLHSSIQADQEVVPGDFVNPRTFELASCGAFQLTDERSLLPELFSREEVVTFTTINDLKDKIDYFLTRPQERLIFAERARKRVLAEHTYEHRMARLLDRMFAAGLLDGKKTEGDDLLSEADPELQGRIKELLDRYRLSPGVGFEDLVFHIRRAEGRLDDLETSLLFLDEWKKQYNK
ncbi:MAG: glycosyltransferase [Desulfonatronovibrionaceae bacterium]